MIKDRKSVILEKRIERLERLLSTTNEDYGSHVVDDENLSNTMESNHDVRGVKAVANVLAKHFTQATGIELRKDPDHPIIFSPDYGWSDDIEVLDEDEYSYFVINYNVADDDSISVYICPTLGRFGVWVSLVDGRNCEGAVNPKTGKCEWEDDVLETMYPLNKWENFSLDMISDDEDYESVKRTLKRPTKNESSKNITRRVKR